MVIEFFRDILIGLSILVVIAAGGLLFLYLLSVYPIAVASSVAVFVLISVALGIGRLWMGD